MNRMNADWVGLRHAVDRVLETVTGLDSEEIPLRESRGRILAEDIRSPIDLPPWTNSAMDGFACRSVDVRNASLDAPVELRLVDDIPAGGFPKVALGEGTAARIMTGAPVPRGADSVIRVEHTDGGVGIGTNGGRVKIVSESDAGRNLRIRGEEIREGGVALRAGQSMVPAAIGLAAAVGCTSLPVVRRPIVALLTSGDELVEVEDFSQVLEGKRIVSSNSYTLAARLEEIGCRVKYLGIASDRPESLRDLLRGAAGCDALVTSAGISVGEHDHIRSAVLDLEGDVRFWRVRIRPGSPFAFGTIAALGGMPWFGLPGNPVSSLITFELFARPALLTMGGQKRIFPVPIRARLVEDYIAPAGLTQLPRVRLSMDRKGEWEARLTGSQGSGILSSLVTADGLLLVPEDRAGATAGTQMVVLPFVGPLTETSPF